MDAEEYKRKNELLKIHRRRKHELDLKEAQQGIAVEPHITLERQDIEEKIKLLEEEIQGTQSSEADNGLFIDDIIIERKRRLIELDVRLRNAGDKVVNLTRANLHILELKACRAFVVNQKYQPSASYHLTLDPTKEDNLFKISHVLQPNEVDNFIIYVEYNTSYKFTVKLLLYYNGKNVVVSEPFSFETSSL